MTDIVFPEPVFLIIPGSDERKVATSFEALECLEGPWPEGARGFHWRRAVMACRDALDGWRSAIDARRTFVEAAKRAGMLEGSRRSSFRRRMRAPRASVPSRIFG